MFKLVPRDDRFFECFEEQSRYIVEAAALLHELGHEFTEVQAKVQMMKDIEHRGDHITHETFKLPNTR